MSSLVSEKGLKNSVAIVGIATAKITLSNGKIIEVTNPIDQIITLFQFVEKRKNNFLNIGGAMINIDQIASMQWIDEKPLKGNI